MFSRRLRSNFTYDLRQAGCDNTMVKIHAIQAMALVHGLWIEHRVAGTISIDEVLGVFHGLIDEATHQVWRANMRAHMRAELSSTNRQRGLA
jgi:TetR/AcrR family transcriptional repressor of bet genes